MRAEGFVFGHVADEGIMESCAGELLRYRCIIGAEDVLVFADIKKKHWSAKFFFLPYHAFASLPFYQQHVTIVNVSLLPRPVHTPSQVTSVSWKQ